MKRIEVRMAAWRVIVGGNDATDITPLVTGWPDVPKRWEPDARGWVPHGRCVVYRGGRLRVEITYDRGVAHGPYRDYWLSGRVSLEGQYVRGEMDGEWRFYDCDTGQLREVIRYEGGREVIDWDEFFRTARSPQE